MAAKKKPAPLEVLGTDDSDLLVSGVALESFDGGAGLDTLRFDVAGAAAGVTVDLKKGTIIDAAGNRETVRNVEIVVGTDFDDKITGSDATDYLIGGGGNDRLAGGGGHDELYGMEGDDNLNGGDGHDYLVGGRGNDVLAGGKGFDTADYSDDGSQAGIVVNLPKGVVIDGFGATDKVSGVEKFIGTAFADAMTGNGSANVFFGRDGDDQLFGNGGADVLDGGAGDDVLDGGKGDDMLTGGEGDDVLVGGKGVDAADYRTDGGENGISADLGAGVVVDTWGNVDKLKEIEIVKGSVHDDRIVGSDRTDCLDGWDGDDYLFGGKGADELYGAAGHDTLEGGEGSDYLDGGLGHDRLAGGESWDFFVARMDEGHDTVLDFDDVDLVDLRNTSFKSYDEMMQYVSLDQTEDGAGLRIQLGEGSMFLLNVFELKAEDCLFAA